MKKHFKKIATILTFIGAMASAGALVFTAIIMARFPALIFTSMLGFMFFWYQTSYETRSCT